MSAVSKCFQVCSLVGTASSVPFIPSLTEKKVVAELASVTAGGGEVSESTPIISQLEPKPEPVNLPPPVSKKTESKGPDVLQHAMKQIVEERGGKGFTGLGCFWIPHLPGTELFFCFDREDSGTFPYLFHYSWKGSGGVLDRLQKVISMTATVATLRNGKTVKISPQLKLHLQWISSKWKRTTFEPSQHCKVTDNSGNYLLTCSPDNSHSKPAWKKEVPKGQVEDAKPELMATA